MEQPLPDVNSAWIKQKQNRMTVEFPRKPKRQTKSVDAPPLGKLSVEIFVNELSSTKVLMTNQTTYPVSPGDYDVRRGLTGAVEGILKEAQGQLVSKKPINHNGIRGTTLLIDLKKQGMYSRSEIYIDGAGPTYYQIQALGNREFIEGELVSKFFDSVNIEPIDLVSQKNNPRNRKKAPAFEE